MKKSKNKIPEMKKSINVKHKSVKESIGIKKLITRTAMKCIMIISMISFILVPFLHNALDVTVAQWIWYPSCALLLIFIIIDYCKNNEPILENPLFEFLGKWELLFLAFAFISVFVFNYYNIDYIWLWVVFGVVAIFIPFFFLSLIIFDLTHNQRTEDEKRSATLSAVKYVFFYWMLDLFYMSIFNDWLIPTFIFGILAIIILSFDLVTVFLSGIKSIRFFIALNFLFGLGVMAYLFYIIPDTSLQNIVLEIATSAFSGIFTLVAVAWAIKSGEADRQADLKRIENERKNEERKKHIPYIKITPNTCNDYSLNAHIYKGLDLDDPNQRKLLNNDVFYLNSINDFTIKNISPSNIIVKGVSIDNKIYWFENELLLETNGSCRITTTGNWEITLASTIQCFSLIIADVLGNIYKVQCSHSTVNTRKLPITKMVKDRQELKGFCWQYIIENAMLPKLIEEAVNE